MTQSKAPGRFFTAHFWSGILVSALIQWSGAGPAAAADALVAVEATVRGGINATMDQDEVAAGYLHVKYSSPPNLDLARKGIFQFDLTDFVPDVGAAATFQVNFTVSNKQRVQLWGLNQAYPGFASEATWNSAQANDPNSNELLTAGLFSATRIGTDVLLPTSGTIPHTFTIPRLGDFLFAHQLTLVLTGVADPLNNAGGLRLQLATAQLTFTGSNGVSAPSLSSVGNQTIWTNTTTGELPFTLSDDVDAASSLVPFAISSNPDVIPVGNIFFGGAGSNRTVTITAGSQTGSTLVSIYVVDSQSRTGSTAFSVTVQGPNSPNGEHYDVYLAAGQSNMDGRGAASELTGDLAAWSQPQPDVRIYYANPVNNDPLNPTYQTGWQVLRPGWSVPPGFSGALPSTTFGPALAFARTLADAAPDRKLALIKVSQGGTSLSSDWKPASGYMYATLTNITRRALQALTNAGASYTLRGMIWHQGESDGSSSTATYEARLIEFIAAVRHDLGVSNLPVVLGELATNRSVTVRQAQFNVANQVACVGLASSSNLLTLAPDDPHFTARSALLMGQRMAAALELPPLRFSTVGTSGNTLVLTASGLARATAQLRGTTNLASPITHWSVKATKVFDAAGQVTFTNPVLGLGAQEYFLIQIE